MDIAAAIGRVALAAPGRVCGNAVVALSARYRWIARPTTDVAGAGVRRGAARAVHGLVWGVSRAEVSSGCAFEISPVARAEPLDKSPSAAAGAGDVCVAGCAADRRGVG